MCEIATILKERYLYVLFVWGGGLRCEYTDNYTIIITQHYFLPNIRVQIYRVRYFGGKYKVEDINPSFTLAN